MSSGNVWATLARIILRARSVYDARARSGELDYQRCQFENGKFFRVADVDRSGHVIGAIHQANEAIDQIIDITERARLQPVAEYGDIAAEQRLDDKIRDHAAVVGVHARAVGVEDPRDLDAQAMLAPVIKEQGFGAALTLIVAGSRASRVHMAPIIFALRVHIGIAVDFRG